MTELPVVVVGETAFPPEQAAVARTMIPIAKAGRSGTRPHAATKSLTQLFAQSGVRDERANASDGEEILGKPS